MATKLFLNAPSGIGGSDYSTGNNDPLLNGTASAWLAAYQILASQGLGPNNFSQNTVTGPTNGVELAGSPGAQATSWISPPLSAAVTISGAITLNIWASESSLSANAAINGILEVIDGATGTLTLIAKSARVTELTTSTAVSNFTVTPASGVACKAGDRLRFRIFADDAGTMASGFTFAVAFAGNTPGATGDTWFQLTENVTFVSEPAGTQVFPTDTAVTVASGTAPSLLSNFTGADENPLSEGGNWTILDTHSSGTNFKRLSNKAVGTLGGPGFNNTYWVPANFGPDVEAHGTLGAFTGGSAAGISFRGSSPGATPTYYIASASSTQAQVARYIAGSFVSLITIPATWAVGDQFGVAVNGSEISIYRFPSGGSAWAFVGSVRDTAISGAGNVGLYSSDTATGFSDLYVGPWTGYFAAAVQRQVWTSRGAGVQSDVTNSVTGFTPPLLVTDTAGGTVVEWYSPGLSAFTLSQAVRVNARVLVSTFDDVAIRCEVAVVNGDGTGAQLWGATTSSRQLNTSEAAASFLVSGDDLAVSLNQRLRVRFFLDDPDKAMVTGQTLTLFYAGTSGGASGDTFLTFTQSLSLGLVTVTGSYTADAYAMLAPLVWTTPADTVGITATPNLQFQTPSVVGGDMHFEMQLDTVNTFNSGNLRDQKSIVDQTGWQYWNGTTWVAVPNTGMPHAFAGNEARYNPASLPNGTWYRRVRLGLN